MAQATASTFSADQKKFIEAKLIQRGYVRCVAKSVCRMVTLPKGHGLNAYFTRFERLQVPVSQLTEGGSDPTAVSPNITQVSATMDYWGAVVETSDIALAATFHDVAGQISELLSDSAQRIMDREVQIVWLAGTNVIYGDGTVTARNTITSSMKMTEVLMDRAVVQLEHQQAPQRGGPSGTTTTSADGDIGGGRHYLAIMPPQVAADVRATASTFGSWAAVQTYQDKAKIYNGEVGSFRGLRVVTTNFMPIITLLGNATAAVTSGNDLDGGSTGTNSPKVTAVNGGGSLTSATTYYFKVSRKDLLRGFEESISIEHTMASAATGDNESFTFLFPSNAAYAWNVYFGSSTGDANLKLAGQNQAAGTTLTVTAVPSSTTTAPANIKESSSNPAAVYVVYIHGDDSCGWVGMKDLQFYSAGDESTIGALLQLRRQWGYKFYAKSLIFDQTRILRLEVAATHNPSNILA